MSTIQATVFVLSLVILIGCVLVYARYRFAKNELKRLEHLKRWRDDFFASIAPILKDDDTPLDVLEHIEFSIEHIDDQRLARSLLKFFMAGLKKRESSLPPKETMAFFDRKPELREAFRNYMQTLVIAASFNDRHGGPLLRELFAEVLADPDENRAVVRTAEAIESTENSLPECLAAA